MLFPELNRPVYLDGGQGTLIQAAGITGFSVPEELTLTEPDFLVGLHRRYVEAGSDIVTACTFGANPLKLAAFGLDTYAVYRSGVECVRRAIREVGRKCLVAADIGPVGQLLQPLGKLPFEEAYEAFKTSAIAAEQAGADLIFIETMTDLYEMKAAVLAVRENTKLPLFASMAFEPDLRTLTGSDPLAIATLLESLRVDALGFNCGGSLEDSGKLAKAFCAATSLPVLAEPNAGLPVVENGRTVFKVGPEEFARQQVANAMAGVRILGGCCGTTPEHIAAMIRAMPKELPPRPVQRPVTRVCSSRRTVEIGNVPGGTGPVVIGERINPTGKKRCQAALRAGDTGFVLNEAETQINAGAHILDVNVGVPGIDEAATMVNTVKLLQQTFDTPLQIDSSEPAVLERALRVVNGKPLVNSVNGKQAVMDAVFPLVARYGGTVVALCLDEDGIPPTAEERVAIGRKIIAEAAKYGIKPHDILVDTLTLTISSQQREAMATLRAISQLKSEYRDAGLKTVLGVSNISFGLPNRGLINSHFFGMALFAGLDAGIINPLSVEMMTAFRVYRAVAAFDENCLEYIQFADTLPKTVAAPGPAGDKPAVAAASGPGETMSPLQSAIIKGFADAATAAVLELLQEGKLPIEIVDGHIIPALDRVGRDFESGRKFLPQLLLSAQTVSKAFEVIKRHLDASGERQESKGTVLMATVEGDIHDIGKNIVSAMLENYGFTVVDLGKNVPAERIVQVAVEQKIRMVGLSALMTTTVVGMERTIKLLREAEARTGLKFEVVVGGAVLTEEFARQIGADRYSKDAMATVAAAKQIYGT